MRSVKVLSVTAFAWLILLWVLPEFRAAEGRRLESRNEGFINIDCGATNGYEVPSTGIYYETDTKYVKSGEKHTVSKYLEGKILDEFSFYRTLRSFPSGKRNCYHIKDKNLQGRRLLTRASFMYGNYDGKDQVPIFDIYLGADLWTQINLGFQEHMIFEEVIHESVTDFIDVCLVNISKGLPIISGLEIRILGENLYPINTSEALIKEYRRNLGSSLEFNKRYVSDPYNREWKGYWAENLENLNPNDSSVMKKPPINQSYGVPKEVLQTAVTPKIIEEDTMQLQYDFDEHRREGRYVVLHFAGIGGRGKRVLQTSCNGQGDGTISLDYGDTKTTIMRDVDLDDNNITIWVNATQESVLGPILNAVEIYAIVKLSPTNTNDVVAIQGIKEEYDVGIKNWQGDPCLPQDYLWTGVKCSGDNTPRITSIRLNSSELHGDIKPWFSNFTAVRTIDLSNNELTGPIPDFFSRLPNLELLNLSHNKLEGLVPQALISKLGQNLCIQGNPKLIVKKPNPGLGKRFVIITVCISTSILIMILLVSAGLIIKGMPKGKKLGKSTEVIKSKSRGFTYSDIVRITDNFANFIGSGGFGSVYRGVLENLDVAVKLLSSASKQGYKEFLAEAQLLTIIHHRHLVSLIGYCNEGDNVALIYEYIPNKDLQRYLTGEGTKILDWFDRLQIAIDAASGLEYLHDGCIPQVVHRDLKPANILLDENLRAKLSDFGLSKHFETETSFLSYCHGTPGYFDPEIQITGLLSKKSDVYSFGIVLLELLTGRPAILRDNDIHISIVDFVTFSLRDGNVDDIMDPKLQWNFDGGSTRKFAELAMSCVRPFGTQRPEISEVVLELKECLAMAIVSSSSRVNEYI